MKKNINQKPTIDCVHLDFFAFSDIFLHQDDPLQAPFSMLYQFGDKESFYLGEYKATPGNFVLSVESAKKLKELVSSLENDMATYLFGESKTVSLVEEEDKLPPEIKQSLEYQAEEDPTFQL